MLYIKSYATHFGVFVAFSIFFIFFYKRRCPRFKFQVHCEDKISPLSLIELLRVLHMVGSYVVVLIF